MEETRKCECGCGETIEPRPHHAWAPPRYIKGHWQRTNAPRAKTPPPELIPDGMCECGCGKRTNIVTRTETGRRRFKGHPAPLLKGHGNRRGRDSHHWSGGRTRNREYVLVYAKGSPYARKDGYVLEHRLVMAEYLGRRLLPHETVHHRNGDTRDNRIGNLELFVGRHGRGANHPHCSTCCCFEGAPGI